MSAYSDCKFKYERIALLKEKLGSNIKWATKGLLTIYDFQTIDEKNSEQTRDSNGVGFDAYSAEFLSSLATQALGGRQFSRAQVSYLFKKMPRFAGQLDRIAQSKVVH